MPNARGAGISTDCNGHMRWGDVIKGGDIEEESQRWGRSRRSNEMPPTKQAIPEHRRVRWGNSRDTKATQGTGRRLLSKEEWGCLAEDVTRGGGV